MSEVLLENTRILETDVSHVFEAVYNNNEKGLDVFLAFIYENVEEVVEKYGKTLKLSNILRKLAMKASKKEQLSKVSQ